MPDRRRSASSTAAGGHAQPPRDGNVRLLAAVADTLDGLLAAPIAPALYLIATPIGHLGDISLRALALIARLDAVYCEDTRMSQKLLSRFGIDRRLRIYHEHSDADDRAAILAVLSEGRSVGLISDAGTPGISDPGYKLIRAAVAAGHRVVPVPGPSALVAAVTASGLPTDRFLFAGFLAPKAAQRRQQLEALRGLACTLVFYESPHRLAATLGDMAEVFGAERSSAIGRELTKKFEEIVRGSLGELVDWSGAAAIRGEVAIVVGGAEASAGSISDDVIAARLARELAAASPSQAAKRVAVALGVDRARVYAVGLKSKRGQS
jgi:16S rRNA (cytidine1402-2'-O)-methyltransferase